MGVWTAQPDGSWAYDHNAPSPGTNPALTQIHTVSYPDPGLPSPNSNPPAETAGEQDHTNPWFYAGEPADPPAAC